jgi:hypothetical protein
MLRGERPLESSASGESTHKISYYAEDCPEIYSQSDNELTPMII